MGKDQFGKELEMREGMTRESRNAEESMERKTTERNQTKMKESWLGSCCTPSHSWCLGLEEYSFVKNVYFPCLTSAINICMKKCYLLIQRQQMESWKKINCRSFIFSFLGPWGPICAQLHGRVNSCFG